MKRFACRLTFLGLAIATASLAALFWSVPAEAQTKGKTKTAQPPPKGRSAGEGQERLLVDKDWNKDSAEMRQFQEIRKGAAPLNSEVLDHAAQWYAYRLTYTEYQDPKPQPPGMHGLVREALDQIVNVRDAKTTAAQRTYMEEFGKRFSACLREVAKNPKVIARVNAALILGRLAAAGQESAVDVLVEILQDPKENEGVKLYALRGLKDFLSSGRGESPFTDKEREARVTTALLEYLARKPTLSKDAPPEEVAAVNYVRAEAVAALGQTIYPAVPKVVDKKTHLERRTALALLRVLRKDGIEPPPSLAEQVEAAVGLCQLHSKELEQYNADYAAYHIGRFIVEFVSAYNQGREEKKEPWKIYAHHLSHALDVMNADLSNPPASEHAAYVAALAKQADERLLTPIWKSSKPDVNPNDFSGWLDQNPPKSQSVYKGMPDAVVREGEKTAGS